MRKPKLWDKETLDAREQEKIEAAESARCAQDWQRATTYAERALSDRSRRFKACRLPACRRARACRGNPTICLPAGACQSERLHGAIDGIYVHIQDRRRVASYAGRRLEMIDPVTRKRPKGK